MKTSAKEAHAIGEMNQSLLSINTFSIGTQIRGKNIARGIKLKRTPDIPIERMNVVYMGGIPSKKNLRLFPCCLSNILLAFGSLSSILRVYYEISW